MNILFELFLTFAKIGLFTFGGGYAMISMIEHACVDSKQWVSHDDMMNITVIAESTPGPIAINCATFVGYKQIDNNSCDTQDNMDTTNNQKNRNTYLLSKTV